MPTLKDALNIISKLTKAEQDSLKLILLSVDSIKSLEVEDLLTNERFINGRVCTLCGCTNFVRNGHQKDGTQRYLCKNCDKSFVISSNSLYQVQGKNWIFGRNILIV